MNRKFKTISAALLAATMCASFAGCNNKSNDEINESNIESHLESMFGGGNSSSPETSEPGEEKIEMTDEIKKAALNSGFVQYNNDVFQRGGYTTVADFVEKYKDTYDITYMDGTYEERKDYLLEYKDDYLKMTPPVGRSWNNRSDSIWHPYGGTLYTLTLTPKNGNGDPLNVYAVNATSPDEKITLDKAIVAEIEPGKYSTVPEWIPMGFNNYSFRKEYESENANYNVKNIGEALEAQGLKKNSEFEHSNLMCPSCLEPVNYNTYWKSGNSYGCYILGEENLFGAKPLYYYSFSIDSNTDKLDYVSCTLEYFFKE